uniref:Uncharacterized protein n=1 Tax=Romanomermis culicivorax TaxID=13658 RepID=A0A915KSM2_ROMCU
MEAICLVNAGRCVKWLPDRIFRKCDILIFDSITNIAERCSTNKATGGRSTSLQRSTGGDGYSSCSSRMKLSREK